MIVATQWQNQDILSLSTEQWLEILQNTDIFDNDGLAMIDFVYQQPNYTSTASDIASHFNVHYNKVTAQNRRIAKKLYSKFSQEPPGDDKGNGFRYWNTLFDGIPEHPQDENSHFYWRLRPNLIRAWEIQYN